MQDALSQSVATTYCNSTVQMPQCWMTDYPENKLWKQLLTVALQSCSGKIPTQTQVYSCDSSAQTCIIFTLDTIVLDTVCKIWLPPLQSFHGGSIRNLVTGAPSNLDAGAVTFDCWLRQSLNTNKISLTKKQSSVGDLS